MIVAVGGNRVASLEELRDVLADHKPGDTVKIELYRGDDETMTRRRHARPPARRLTAASARGSTLAA